jgi:hypothetical protein
MSLQTTSGNELSKAITKSQKLSQNPFLSNFCPKISGKNFLTKKIPLIGKQILNPWSPEFAYYQ